VSPTYREILEREIPPAIPAGLRHALGAFELGLDDLDESLAVVVGRERLAVCDQEGWTPRVEDGIERSHRDGARGELAVARCYGAAWIHPVRNASNLHLPDVGNVDVRATARPGSEMPIREGDPLERAHVRVELLGPGRYRVVGWIYGFDAKLVRYRRPASDRGAAYWSVPLEALSDPAWLPIERLPIWTLRKAEA